jgi:hypothetical protein
MASISSPNVIQDTSLQGFSSFADAALRLANLREQRYQSDRLAAIDQIDNMAKEANLPLNLFLRDQKGKQAVMAFAPRLFRGGNAQKQAEDWINAYTSVGLENAQARKLMEDAFVRGDITGTAEETPGQTPDWRAAYAQYQQQQAGGIPVKQPPAQAPGVQLPPVQPLPAQAQDTGLSANDELNAAFSRSSSQYIQSKPVTVLNNGQITVRDRPDPTTTQRFVVTDPTTGQPAKYPDGSVMAFDSVDQANTAYRGLLYKIQEQKGTYQGESKAIADRLFTPTPKELADRQAAAEETRLRTVDANRRTGGAPAGSQGPSTASQGRTPSTPAPGSQLSFRQFLVEKAKVVPGIDISPTGTESDAQLMANSPKSRVEYEAYKRGITPAWAQGQSQVGSAPTSQATPVSVSEGAGGGLSGATSIKFTEEEAAALKAYSEAVEPGDLTTKDQVYFNKALSKLTTQGQKEKVTFKLNEQGRARYNQATADAIDTALNVLSPDSEFRNDPRFSHLFENPTQLGIDYTKSQIRYQQVMTDKALQDLGFAGEELALKKRQIAALEVSNQVDLLKAKSPAFEKLVEAIDSSLSRYEEPLRKRLENVKSTKELEKVVKEIESTLLQIPGYKAEKEAWTRMVGNWSELGVSPIEVALVKRGWFGIGPSGNVAGTLTVGGGGVAPVGDETSAESAYTEATKQDILTRYGR